MPSSSTATAMGSRHRRVAMVAIVARVVDTEVARVARVVDKEVARVARVVDVEVARVAMEVAPPAAGHTAI